MAVKSLLDWAYVNIEMVILADNLTDGARVVDKNTQNEVWAHTYVGFDQCLYDMDRRLSSALGLYLRALRHKPSYLSAWKAIIKAILNWEKRVSQ